VRLAGNWQIPGACELLHDYNIQQLEVGHSSRFLRRLRFICSRSASYKRSLFPGSVSALRPALRATVSVCPQDGATENARPDIARPDNAALDSMQGWTSPDLYVWMCEYLLTGSFFAIFLL